MRTLEDKRLYTDTDYGLTFLSNLKLEISESSNEKIIFHTYWHGQFSLKQALSVKSFLCTQDLDKNELWVWLDEEAGFGDYQSNPHLSPLLPLLTVKKYSPWKEARATPLQTARYLSGFSRKGRAKKRLLNEREKLTRRADVFRILILYKYGGLYFDTDILFLRDFEDLFHFIPEQEFCYQWSSQQYANNAVFKLQKNSKVASDLLNDGITKENFLHDLLDFNNAALDVLVLPSVFFDPLWLHHDKKDVSRLAHFDEFGDFFKPNAKDEYVAMKDLFKGSFAYHWHNEWSVKELANSYAGQIDQELNGKLRKKYGIMNLTGFS